MDMISLNDNCPEHLQIIRVYIFTYLVIYLFFC